MQRPRARATVGSKKWANHVIMYHLLGYEPLYTNELETAGKVLRGELSEAEAGEHMNELL